MTWVTARTCVYDVFVDGQLVYVGSSRQPEIRFQCHKREGRVPPHAVLKVVRWFDNHAVAMAVEVRRIKRKKPPLNVAGIDERDPRIQKKNKRLWAEWEAERARWANMLKDWKS